MVTKRLTETLLAIAMLPVMLSQPALAHVVWFDFDKNNAEYDLLFGHPEIGPEPIDVAKFREATAYDTNKQVVPAQININPQNGISVVPQGEIAALTAFFDNGFWLENLSDGSFENITQQEAEALNYVNVTNFVKYTKALYDWSAPVQQSFGLPLEIMPLQNPLEVAAGGTLPIQVLFQGNVVNDALVEYLGQTVNLNQNGTFDIPIGQGGLQVIEANYSNPTATNPGISYAASFTAQQTVPEPSALLGLSVLGLMAFAGKQGKKLKSTRTSDRV